MLRNVRIGPKVFGLSVVLITLMVLLSVFNTVRSAQVRRDLDVLTKVCQPLAEELTLIDVSGARRRLAFSRLLDQRDTVIDPEAQGNLVHFNAQLDSLFVGARARVAWALVATASMDSVLHGLSKGLAHLDDEEDSLSMMQGDILAEQRTGLVVAEALRTHDRRQTSFQEERKRMRDLAFALSDRTALSIREQQRQLLRTTQLVTAIAVVLGLLVAWAITRQLVGPVRTLLGGVGRVEQGDLDIQLPIVTGDEIGVLTGSFNRMVNELRGKQVLRETFGRYVDPRVVEHLLVQGSDATASRRQEMTVLFADLVGFTPLSERLDAADLVAFLNAHFTIMAEVLHAHGAVVDKYMGDAVMAYWGEPFVPGDLQAVEACRAAMEMTRRFDVFTTDWLQGRSNGTARPGLCIGIATGEMVVGNIGSQRAMSWTVVGEAVNLAARLEKLNRAHGTRILAPQRTHDLAASWIAFRSIGDIPVKGVSEAIAVYEVLAAVGDDPHLHTSDQRS